MFMRWGIWYAGNNYGGPRWCREGTEIEFNNHLDAPPAPTPPRLEYDSREAAERDLPYMFVGFNHDRSLYSVQPL